VEFYRPPASTPSVSAEAGGGSGALSDEAGGPAAGGAAGTGA
jgi:hypothetical protein